ncbi:MAG: protein translocase subunit SecF [Candidatus Marinimicrobia bacterium]|nr:protein translocase subunit SecF [Candidatus Neomarinimicrobiota bacterium]
MQIFKNTLQINFSSYNFFTGILSCLLILTSLFILFWKGLNLTVEFTGGTNINISIIKTQIKDFREILETHINQKIEVVEVNSSSENSNFLLRTKFIENESFIIDQLSVYYPTIKVNSIDSFGPKLGSELKSSARNAILLALLLISFYIAIRFDRYYALGSLAALTHDVVITIGLLSFFNIEIGITIIAALLTIVGYSLNDTIVVYDRIRENINKLLDQQRINIINRSINETLNRTFVTSITTLAVVLVLFFYGGVVLKPFAFTLIIGIIIGTYSSIFIASPVMLFFEEKYPIPEFKEQED